MSDINTISLIRNPDERKMRIREKRKALVQFLASEIYTHHSIVQELLHLGRRQTDRTLVGSQRAGLLHKHQVDLGYGKLVPIWGLTPKAGLLLNTGYFEPGRVSPTKLEHALSLQRARVRAEAAGWEDWQNERRILSEGAFSRKKKKIPDAVATSPNGSRVAIELERTIKTSKRYRAILAHYVVMIERGDIEKVIYITDSAGVATRLRSLFHAFDYVLLSGRRYSLKGSKNLDRFSFCSLRDWPGSVRDE